MGKRKTQEEFIEDAFKVHGKKFDYSLTKYKGVKNKIKIKCPQGHIFEQSPNDHLNGHGCKKCGGWGKYSNSNNNFIKDLKRIYKNSLDFTQTKYKGWEKDVIITCPKHGDFKKRARGLINKKQGCPKCGRERTSKKNKWDLKTFVEKANFTHNSFYDYSKVNYNNSTSKVIIICPNHGEFLQAPKDHINKTQGCPKCKNSKGENIISSILTELNIKFIPQYTFEDCINQRKLPFDFFLPGHNICIEFDGEQHFFPIELFGGEETFNYIKHNDEIKNQYCINNNIKLIRINYKQISKINQILKNYV